MAEIDGALHGAPPPRELPTVVAVGAFEDVPAASPKPPALSPAAASPLPLHGDLAARRLPLDYRRNCGLVRFLPYRRVDFPMAELLARPRRFRPPFDVRPKALSLWRTFLLLGLRRTFSAKSIFLIGIRPRSL
jgi:hypothetical protein